MAIPTTCPGCKASYNLGDKMAGKKVRCNSCGQIINVGTTPPPGSPEAARVTKTPGGPAKPATIPSGAAEKAAGKAPNTAAARPGKEPRSLPPVKRAFPVVLVLVVVLGLGVLLAGGATAGGLAWYWYANRSASPAPVAQPKIEKPDGEQKLEPEKKAPAEFNITEVRKSVVYVKRLNGVGTAVASGSGFLVSTDGLIYTNRHVIEGSAPNVNADLLIGVPSRKDPNTLEYFKAAVVYAPPQTDALDFAVLKIAARPDYGEFPTLTLSADKPGLGDPVAAVGYPAINDIELPTLSFNKGTISAAVPVLFEKRSFYQTDAAINAGNSGGPLVNARGEVVAVVTLKKRGANNMSYALRLSEIEAVAKPKPEQLALAKPEAGPVDLKALPQATSIPPEAAKWLAGRGQIREQQKQGTRFLTVDGNGGVFWMTTREDLPEHFQLTATIGVEPFIGGYNMQASQRSLLGTLLVRFAAADPAKSIIEKGPGYQIKSTFKYTQLNRNETEAVTEQGGHPDDFFQLTVIRRNGEIIVQADDQVLLKYVDPNPLPGRAKFSIGGLLSRLYVMGDVKVMALDGNGPNGPIIVKKDPKKEPIDLAKPGKDDGPKEPDKPQANEKGPGDKPPDKPSVGTGDRGDKVVTLKTDKEERPLPGSVNSVCVGGGGRFLFFHLGKERKIAVFDVSEAKVVKYLPVTEDNVKIAACQDKLIVVLPTANVIQRYNLTTFEREVTTAVPGAKSIGVALMGSASYGPLVLCGDGSAVAIDPYTLQALPGIKLGFRNPQELVLRMSADARVITSYTPNSSPQGHLVWVREGDTYKQAGLDGEAAGMMAPGPEGRFIYTARGLYTAEGKPTGKRGTYGDGSRYSLPAVEGEAFYLRIDVPGFPHGDKNPGRLFLHLSGDDNELGAIDAPVPAGINTWGREAFGIDQHFFLVPSARLLVVLSPTRDLLTVYRLDLEKLLEKSNRDYLVVLSRPPAGAERGSRFAYSPVIKSKKGGVKVKLESGPTGLKVGDDGKVTWDVPKDFADNEADVVLTVGDAGSQEKFHTFRLTIRGTTEPGAKEPPPDPKPVAKDSPIKEGPGMGAIKVAPLKEDREERNLPSPAGDVCAGGGGRFLILHLPRDRKLAIFDVNEAKIVKYVPVTEDDVKFAAGRDKLFVVNPKSEVLQHYSLTTFEKETTVPLPGTGKVYCLAMGSASATPLLLGRTSGAIFLDPITLKQVGYEREKDCPGLEFRDARPIHVRVSADGRLITGWAMSGSPTGLWAWRIDGKTMKGVYKHESPGPLFPGADGSTFFAPGQLYAADATPLGKHVGGFGSAVWYVPATQGRYYLALNQKEKEIGLGLHLLGDDRQLVALPGVDGVGDLVDLTFGQTAAFDKQVHFIADAKLLVVLPKAKDKLVLHRVDVDALVEKSGVDYLFVTSVPPAQFVPGRTLTYTPAVKSKKGSVKVKMELGPAGMTLSPKNELIWKVPVDFADAETTVMLTIGDATGQEVSHTFRLTKDKPSDK